jgi:glycosyltransferase involved in cell wall biosynthesis
MIVGCARIFRLRTYIHHHSFSYVVEYSKLMSLLLAWSGEDAVHICLCNEMAKSLASRYRRSINSIILSNAAFVDLAASKPIATGRDHLVIGLLSNLTSDKGLYEFLEILRTAKDRDLRIRGVLAGPVSTEKDKMILKSSSQELGGYLDYRGPVYGDDKARFFNDIDVFVFFTTYLNEAQPTVLFEAMACGIPVISYDRGCISCQVADAGFVFARGTEIIADTVKVLNGYRADRETLERQKRAALAHFERERSRSQVIVANLFDTRPARVSFHDAKP